MVYIPKYARVEGKNVTNYIASKSEQNMLNLITSGIIFVAIMLFYKML